MESVVDDRIKRYGYMSLINNNSFYYFFSCFAFYFRKRGGEVVAVLK